MGSVEQTFDAAGALKDVYNIDVHTVLKEGSSVVSTWMLK